MQFQQPNNNQQQQIQVKADDSVLKGAYANNMQVAHTKEEFIVDFMNLFPPVATLNARIIVSPGHMKRMLAALTENMRLYEQNHGAIEAAVAPSEQEVGFKTA
jgi:hypothetical protein